MCPNRERRCDCIIVVRLAGLDDHVITDILLPFDAKQHSEAPFIKSMVFVNAAWYEMICGMSCKS